MGVGLFWKQKGPTSNEELANIKRSLGLPGPIRKNIGHGGTLDPFAEGWLLVGWDEGTKVLGALKLSKTYIAEIYLGASTETLDDTIPMKDWGIPIEITEEKLKAFLVTKVGKSEQMPSHYSAKKVDGQTSYEMIRKGVALDLKAAPIEIFSADHLSLVRESAEKLRWTIKVKVSAGTYIRCLARDWAQELFGHPAMLTRLARVGYGNFVETSSVEPNIISDMRALEPFFEFSDQERAPTPLADKGHILLSESGQPKAAWLLEAARWRYFNDDPLR